MSKKQSYKSEKDGLELEAKNTYQSGMKITAAGRKFDDDAALRYLSRVDMTGEWIFNAGKDWPEFDYRKGLGFLANADKTGEWIYKAGGFWPWFDFKEGLDALIEVNRTGEWIYNAGENWKEFDFEKGLNALIEISNCELIYLAGLYWKKIDYNKGLSHLKKRSKKYYDRAKENWPLSAKEAVKAIDRALAKTKKIPNKKMVLESSLKIEIAAGKKIYDAGIENSYIFDFKRGLDALIKVDKTGEWIFRAGKDWKKFDHKRGGDALINKKSVDIHWIYMAGLNWKIFDYEKGLDVFIEKKASDYILGAGKHWKELDYEKALDFLIREDDEEYVYEAGKDWKKFNYKKGIEYLKSKRDSSYYDSAKKDWPLSAKEAIDTIDIKATKTKKIPNKKMVLEATKNKSSAQQIFFYELRNQRDFGNYDNHDSSLNKLIKLDDTGRHIAFAGAEWKKFDYPRGYKAILEKDNTGFGIYLAGAAWEKWHGFDYKKGFEELIKRDKSGEWITQAGKRWKEFDFKRGFDALIEKDKVGSWILNAGIWWRSFDYNKGLDALIKVDKDGTFIYEAGKRWQNFDHEKAFAALAKVDETGEWIFRAGLKGGWSKFDREAAFDILKNKSERYYKLAIREWPVTASSVIRKIDSEEKDKKKIPNKKMVLENKLDKSLSSFVDKAREDINRANESQDVYWTKEGWKKVNYEKTLDVLIKAKAFDRIVVYGSKWKKFDYEKAMNFLFREGDAEHIYEAGDVWPVFDYEKGLDIIINKTEDAELLYNIGVNWTKVNYEKLLKTLLERDKIGFYIYNAKKDWRWPGFDHKKALETLKRLKNKHYYNLALNEWPLSAKEAIGAMNKKKKANKIPNKKLVLENLSFEKDFDNIVKSDENGGRVYDIGKNWKDFDFKKGLDALIEKDKTGQWIYNAGKNWKQFDFEKGLDALIDKKFPDVPHWIYMAGIYWKQFDFEKGLSALYSKDKTGYYIYNAGSDWPKFNHKKGLEMLENKGKKYYFRLAKKEWPITAKETIELIDSKKKKKIPNKKLVLEDFHNQEAKDVFENGKENPDTFDFKKGFEELIKTDKTGQYIFLAGKFWKEFNFERGYEELLKDERSFSWFIYAGNSWEQFDLKRGFDEVIKRDKGGVYITRAGHEWKEFDYNKGLDSLLKDGIKIDNIIMAGYRWPKFDYEKALDFIIKKDNFGKYTLEAGRWRKIGDKTRNKAFEALMEKKSYRHIYEAGKVERFSNVGLRWKKFDYKRALKFLRDGNKTYYRKALKDWPKSAKSTINTIDRTSKNKIKIPNKKKILEDNNYNQEAKDIFGDGILNLYGKFDYKKGFEELLRVDKTGEFIYEAGLWWGKKKFGFPFDKGLDAIIEKDKTGCQIYRAGRDWKEFDYDKGLDALLKPNRKTKYILYAGNEWKKFDYKKAIDYLKTNRKEKYTEALEYWKRSRKKMTAKNLLNILNAELKDKKKIPNKKLMLEDENTEIAEKVRKVLGDGMKLDGFDHEEGFEFLTKTPFAVNSIVWAGKHWKKFNYKKGLDFLIENDKAGWAIAKAGVDWKEFDYKKGMEALFKKDKTGEHIYTAGYGWKEFDYDKGTQLLIERDKVGDTIILAGWLWKRFDYVAAFNAILERDKTGSLVNSAASKWKMNRAEMMYFYDKAFNFIKEKDKTGYLIYEAGCLWHSRHFDYKKAADVLIEKDKKGIFIYKAGRDWREFNYERGLNELIKKNIPYKWIYEAGREKYGWKEIDRVKALEYLKANSKKYYNKALKYWPETANVVIGKIDQEENKRKKIPNKKMVLEARELSSPYAWELYKKGRDTPENFDFKKGLDELIKNDEAGQHTVNAGKHWKEFDFEKGYKALLNKKNAASNLVSAGTDWKQFDYQRGLNDLIKVDKSGEDIYCAGLSWKEFDYERGFDVLIKKVASAEERASLWVYFAGLNWKKFDYERGLDVLIEKKAFDHVVQAGIHWKEFDYKKAMNFLFRESEAEHIYDAGVDWQVFDYKKGLEVLEKKSDHFFDLAKNDWPLSAKETIDVIDNKSKNVKKISNKKKMLEDNEDHPEENEGYVIYDSVRKGELDPKEGLNFLIKIGDPSYICMSGKDWKEFDYKEGLDSLIRIGDPEYIYRAGKDWKEFDKKKGFEAIKKIEKKDFKQSGRNITFRWLTFAAGGWGTPENRKEVIDILEHYFNKTSIGSFKSLGIVSRVLAIGESWKDYDFDRLFKILIKYGNANHIITAGKKWNKFDYNKGFKILKKMSPDEYYKKALEEWPKSAKQTIKDIDIISKEERKKIPNRKLVLENTRKAIDVIDERIKNKDTFDYKKGLDELIELDKDGYWIVTAGKYWTEFDYKKAQEALTKLKNSSKYLSEAGFHWKKFDYKKAFDIVLEKDMVGGSDIFLAGKYWPEFDYEKGFDALIEKDLEGHYISKIWCNRQPIGNWEGSVDVGKAVDALIKAKRNKILYKISDPEKGWYNIGPYLLKILDYFKNNNRKYFLLMFERNKGSIRATDAIAYNDMKVKARERKGIKKIPNRKLVLENMAKELAEKPVKRST